MVLDKLGLEISSANYAMGKCKYETLCEDTYRGVLDGPPKRRNDMLPLRFPERLVQALMNIHCRAC